MSERAERTAVDSAEEALEEAVSAIQRGMDALGDDGGSRMGEAQHILLDVLSDLGDEASRRDAEEGWLDEHDPH